MYVALSTSTQMRRVSWKPPFTLLGRLSRRRALGSPGEAVDQGVEHVALIVFHLQQIVAAVATGDEFRQRPLGEDRIAGDQTQHRISVQQIGQAPPEKRRFVGLFGPGRPLADDHLQVVDEGVEHLERIAVVVERSLGRLALDGHRAAGRFLGDPSLQPGG